MSSSKQHVWVALAGLLLMAPASWAQSGAVDPTFFGTKLYPVLEAAGCRGCHTHDGVASGTRLTSTLKVGAASSTPAGKTTKKFV